MNFQRLGWVLPVLLLYPACSFLIRAFYTIQYPYGIDYMEGVMLDYLHHTRMSGHYFLPVEEPPFLHASYPPLFTLLALPLYWATGPALWVVRLPSILFSLGTAFVLFRIARRHVTPRSLAFSIGLLFLVPWFVQYWGSLGRVDILATFLSILGLHLFDRASGDPHSPKLTLAFSCFVLAFFAKHNFVLAAGAVFVSCLLDPRQRRHLLRYGLLYGVPLLLIFGLLVLVTRGQFYLHLFPYTATVAIDPESAFEYIRGYALLVSPFLAIGLVVPWLMPELGLRTHPYFFYFLFSNAALIAVGKDGANTNYFLEPFASVLALLAVILGRLERHRPDIARLWPAVLLLALAPTLVLVGHRAYALPTELTQPESNYEQVELARLIERTPGPILAEDIAALSVARRPVPLEPFQFYHLAVGGFWNPEPLLEECRTHRYDLIVSGWRIEKIPGMRRCLRTYYKPVRRLGRYRVLVPR